MNTQNITAIFKLLHNEFPNPKTELNYSSTFELLIAVILSAHTTDKSVNQATAKLFPVANTPQKFLSLGITRLKKYIKSVGLYNAKAANITKTCKMLVLEHNSQVPNQRELLEKLPGVGRKTASVILNIAFDQPTIAVDTHIFRVANRTGLAKGKTPLEIENQLLKITPEKFLKIAHHLLLLHGRYVCKAQKPLCNECIINKLCKYYKSCRYAATFRDGVSQGENRDSPLGLLTRIYFAPTLKFLKIKKEILKFLRSTLPPAPL